LILGLLLYCIGGVGAGLVNDFSIHLFLRGLVGAGMGLISPVQNSLVADFFQGEERAKMFGLCLTVSKSFAIIVPPLSAWIATYNWRYAFFINVISLFVLIFILFMLNIPAKTNQLVPGGNIKNRIPPIVFLYAFFAFIMMSLSFIIVTDLTYLMDTKIGISPMISAYGLSANTIGTMLAGMSFPKLYSKLKKWLVSLGCLFFGAGFLLVVSSDSSPLILLGLLFDGMGFGILISMITLVTTNAVGKHDSTSANSVVNSATSFGVAFSPLFWGRIPTLIKELLPVQSNFMLVSLVFMAFGLLSTILCAIPKKGTPEEKSFHKHFL